MKIFDKTLIKFLSVGIVNTLVGSTVMFLTYNFMNFSYWMASASNYIIGGIVSFFLNKYFTFNNTEHSFRQVLFFVLNLAVCYIVAYILAKKIIYLLLDNYTKTLKENIAFLLGMVLYTIMNYFSQRFIIFKDKYV